MADFDTRDGPRSEKPSAGQIAKVMLPLILAFSLAAIGARWVSRIPETREQLIAALQAQDEFLQHEVGNRIERVEGATDELVNQIDILTAKIESLPIDDKSRLQLVADLRTFSASTAELSNEFGEFLKAIRANKVTTIPSFSLFLVGEAHAQSVTKSSRTKALTPWIQQPGSKLWLAVGFGFLFAVFFGVIFATTSDRKKREFSEKMISNSATFLLGLAGGATIPNL